MLKSIGIELNLKKMYGYHECETLEMALSALLSLSLYIKMYREIIKYAFFGTAIGIIRAMHSGCADANNRAQCIMVVPMLKIGRSAFR